MKIKMALASIASAVFLAGCSTAGSLGNKVTLQELADAEINPTSSSRQALLWMPAPAQRVPIAVYGIADQTGAFKPSETSQSLSRAVTQGATPILVRALQDVGNRSWFSIVERENLDHLLKERQIINEMRQRYLGEKTVNVNALPAMMFAGIIVEGAIVGYDTNTKTGGAGARYLGIGGFTEYREDTVSVFLRAVSVKTGEVLMSVNTQQKVAALAVQGNVFKYVAYQELLEMDAGYTVNQPKELAVRQAIERGVYAMVVEGARLGVWGYADPEEGRIVSEHYDRTYAPKPTLRSLKNVPPELVERRMAALAEQEMARLAVLSEVDGDIEPES